MIPKPAIPARSFLWTFSLCPGLLVDDAEPSDITECIAEFCDLQFGEDVQIIRDPDDINALTDLLFAFGQFARGDIFNPISQEKFALRVDVFLTIWQENSNARDFAHNHPAAIEAMNYYNRYQKKMTRSQFKRALAR